MVLMIEKEKDKTITSKIKAMQYTKKLVSLVVFSTFILSCFGTYINFKNGYSLDSIVLKWIDFAIWIGGIYLAKAFAETYAQEKNTLERDIIEMQFQNTANQINVEEKQFQEYEDVEI